MNHKIVCRRDICAKTKLNMCVNAAVKIQKSENRIEVCNLTNEVNILWVKNEINTNQFSWVQFIFFYKILHNKHM